MSDIFISYKREDQATARKLADALEKESWSVWWDPKLRAGEHFDDVIEKALSEARCVIVMWSDRAVQSRYVRDEATYALDREKLVPVAIENVILPLRFRGLQTPSLLGWDGSKDASEFRRLVEDIAAIIGRPVPEAGRKADEKNRNRIEQEVRNSWQTYGPLAIALAVVLIVFSLIFWWPNRPGPEQAEKLEQPKEITAPGKVFRDQLKSGDEGPEMVRVPAGSFQMGQGGGEGDEQPLHSVRIRKPFTIGRYEVTSDEYYQFTRATGRKVADDQGWGGGRRPVINVAWYDAVEYTKWLSGQSGKHYRLPSEAEWEYAARGGKETSYWWGQNWIKGMANCSKTYLYTNDDCGSQWEEKTAPAGSFKPNPFGLYDTAGNVWEWVEDCWHENYSGAPMDGSPWTSGGDCGVRVVRGGSWRNSPWELRSSYRFRFDAVHRDDSIGFRLARDLD